MPYPGEKDPNTGAVFNGQQWVAQDGTLYNDYTGQWEDPYTNAIINKSVGGEGVPSAPSTKTINGVTYEWNGTDWVPSTSLPQQVTNVNVAAPVTWGPSQEDTDGSITGVRGATYQVNSRGDVSVINKPKTKESYPGSGITPEGISIYAIPSSKSPTGYVFANGQPINPDGSPYTGAGAEAETTIRNLPNGDLALIDAKGNVVKIIGAAPPPKLSIPSGGGGGGGGSAAHTCVFMGEQAYQDADSFERLKYKMGITTAENAKNRAQQAARDAASDTIQRAQTRLALGKGLAESGSAIDPAAYSLFQLATGGGIWGGLKGGLSALSQRALQPGAEMLAALRELDAGPADIPYGNDQLGGAIPPPPGAGAIPAGVGGGMADSVGPSMPSPAGLAFQPPATSSVNDMSLAQQRLRASVYNAATGQGLNEAQAGAAVGAIYEPGDPELYSKVQAALGGGPADFSYNWDPYAISGPIRVNAAGTGFESAFMRHRGPPRMGGAVFPI